MGMGWGRAHQNEGDTRGTLTGEGGAEKVGNDEGNEGDVGYQTESVRCEI